MLSIEFENGFQSVADQLAERALIRAEAVDAWVSLALQQPNPDDWASALVAAALNKLHTVPERLNIKAEARLQLLDMRRANSAGIANSRRESPHPLPFETSELQAS